MVLKGKNESQKCGEQWGEKRNIGIIGYRFERCEKSFESKIRFFYLKGRYKEEAMDGGCNEKTNLGVGDFV